MVVFLASLKKKTQIFSGEKHHQARPQGILTEKLLTNMNWLSKLTERAKKKKRYHEGEPAKIQITKKHFFFYIFQSKLLSIKQMYVFQEI